MNNIVQIKVLFISAAEQNNADCFYMGNYGSISTKSIITVLRGKNKICIDCRNNWHSECLFAVSQTGSDKEYEKHDRYGSTAIDSKC